MAEFSLESRFMRNVAAANAHSLPSFLAPLFWEYEFKQLHWASDRDLVIRKILADGDWQSVCWLRTVISAQSLKEWITARKSQGLTPKQLRYWELILGINHGIVNQWLDEKMKDPWYRRTAK